MSDAMSMNNNILYLCGNIGTSDALSLVNYLKTTKFCYRGM